MEYAGAEYIFVLPQVFDVLLSDELLREASDFSKSTGSPTLERGTSQANSRDTIPIRPAANQVLSPQNTTIVELKAL